MQMVASEDIGRQILTYGERYRYNNFYLLKNNSNMGGFGNKSKCVQVNTTILSYKLKLAR